MPDVRPATADQFDEIYPLLLDFGHSPMSRDDWRRMIFDLPWPVEEPHRGYVLVDHGEVVGFIGTIFSAREIVGTRRRICNLSSWIVKETHRSSSIQLLLPVLALKSHTIINWSASAAAHEIFTGLGFKTLEDRQVMVVPLPRPGEIARWSACETILGRDAIRGRLDPAGARIFDDMSGTLAGQALLVDGDRNCHVIATRSRWKGRAMLAHVRYASDWSFVHEHWSLVSWAFFRRLGTVGLRLDGRHVPGVTPPFSARRPLALPPLYRPAEPDLTPERVDGLYSEVVNQRW